ncbi:hypothetical protein H112_01846 [Trichophyton rubrum D6]|uniref:Uncharacterized protein n=2 Tax=Trichophyton TaxID=5550 RepID=A0A022WC21_TRIRU|nr:hypothetical protein H100_01843 [Trichophyton rubrum MR850]EZF44969.1 hypothetical protein H102_01840 [Trichophyton rubrum CBS 100081]EZF55603.1 hypothetical protein H103_01849 [Trichophyton rubrum CBS 288.86]EZF66240.1 hypothetical protein H104_01824 [Trichophyton rubrum CBS 289.86]EZF76906.1 hypothetical protein H105_01852 [Trichophyton soudanense CBS 452.61]EZF87476.1 hypothetical protein H110_01849 [Trichophyton rubrum MR1448]EZF98310.1 hypothetical protein H113_01847 [Trichophyton rub
MHPSILAVLWLFLPVLCLSARNATGLPVPKSRLASVIKDRTPQQTQTLLAATAFRLRVLIDFLERPPKRGDRITRDEKVVLRTFETVFGQVWWAPTNDEA